MVISVPARKLKALGFEHGVVQCNTSRDARRSGPGCVTCGVQEALGVIKTSQGGTMAPPRNS